MLRHSLNQQASSLVIAHNHPLGKAQPSNADITLTQRIATACQLLEIRLIDHCIISAEGTYSFAEHGLIEAQKIM